MIRIFCDDTEWRSLLFSLPKWVEFPTCNYNLDVEMNTVCKSETLNYDYSDMTLKWHESSAQTENFNVVTLARDV